MELKSNQNMTRDNQHHLLMVNVQLWHEGPTLHNFTKQGNQICESNYWGTKSETGDKLGDQICNFTFNFLYIYLVLKKYLCLNFSNVICYKRHYRQYQVGALKKYLYLNFRNYFQCKNKLMLFVINKLQIILGYVHLKNSICF